MAGARFLRPKFLYPALVLACQSLLLAFGWAFYKVTSSRPVALPNHLAIAYVAIPQVFTFVVTLISSTVSIASAYCFSLAMRHLLTSSLSQPISLFAFASGIKVASKGPLLNFTRPWWTLASLICVGALGSQTAGWTTLLTPRPIQVTAEVTGFALDISNPDFLNLANAAYKDGNFISDLLINVLPMIQASGTTAVSADLGLPSILIYNEVSFINNTGGILPANLFRISSGVTEGSDLPVNTWVLQNQTQHTPLTFSRNYTVRQQGFTASVSCEQRDFDESTTPSVQFANNTGNVAGTPIDVWNMFVTCPSGKIANSTTVYGYPDPNAGGSVHGILYAGCHPEDNNSQNATIFLYGIGNYDWINTTVCTATPQITVVDVNYIAPVSLLTISDATNWPSFIDVSDPIQIVDTPLAGGLPVDMIWDSFETAQTVYSHEIGDALSTFYFGSPRKDDPDFINELLAAYFKGVFEFSGTLLRASYTETGNDLFPGNQSTIPDSMKMNVQGTFVSETVGWKQKDATVPLTFIPPTFVILASIGLVIFTLIRTRNMEITEDQDHFDAGNILHVMSAASAGGLPDNFPPFSVDSEGALQYGQSVEVRLGLVKETGRVGFVHSNTTASSSSV